MFGSWKSHGILNLDSRPGKFMEFTVHVGKCVWVMEKPWNFKFGFQALEIHGIYM